jgi:hypothetical protein
MSDEQLGAGDRWGDPISDERKEELGQLLAKQKTWSATLEAEREGRASPFHSVPLTGADVAWLAELSGRDEDGFAPNLHIEGVDLGSAHLETLYVNPSRDGTCQPRFSWASS